MKKILYICDVPLENIGGAQESMKIIIKGLSDKFNFYMITPKSEKQLKNQFIIEDYDEFSISFKIIKGQFIRNYKKTFKLLKKIRAIILDLNPDIIHVQMSSGMFCVGLLKYFNLIPKSIKIIYTDREVLDKYTKLQFLSRKVFCKKFDYITCTTNYNANLYRELDVFVNESNLKVINNTAGYEFDNYNQLKRETLRAEYSIHKEDLVIGFAGRVCDDKNWPLAIDIIDKLSTKYKFKVLIALGTDKSRENIIHANNIIDKIKNIIGKRNVLDFIDIPLSKMQDIYYINDIFILTSKNESFGRTAVEAMSRKNVVFGTRVDGLKEVIGYEEYLYENLDEFIEKINYLINDKHKIHNEKEKFYNHYKNNYSTQISNRKYENLYNNVIN